MERKTAPDIAKSPESIERSYRVVAFLAEEPKIVGVRVLSREDNKELKTFIIPADFFECDFLDPLIWNRANEEREDDANGDEQENIDTITSSFEAGSAKDRSRMASDPSEDYIPMSDPYLDPALEEEGLDEEPSCIDIVKPYPPLTRQAEQNLLIISQIEKLIVEGCEYDIPERGNSLSPAGPTSGVRIEELINCETIKKAGQRVILSNLLFAQKLSWAFHRAFYYDTPAIADLCHEAYLGMLIALRRFDISKENGAMAGAPFPRFLTYAGYWIAKNLRDARANDRSIPIPRNFLENPEANGSENRGTRRKRGPNVAPPARKFAKKARDVLPLDALLEEGFEPTAGCDSRFSIDLVEAVEKALKELDIPPDTMEHNVVVSYFKLALPVNGNGTPTDHLPGYRNNVIAEQMGIKPCRVKKIIRKIFPRLAQTETMRDIQKLFS